MTYRFKSKLATQDRLKLFPVAVQGSGKDQFGPSLTEYEDKFKRVKSQSGFSLFKKNTNEDGFVLYEAPKFSPDTYALAMYFDQEEFPDAFPDILGVGGYLLVSSRFKQLVEELDKLKHQFIPVTTYNKHWKPFSPGQDLYWFNLRRFLTIDGKVVSMTRNSDCIPITGEEEFIFSWQNNFELQKSVEAFPLWRHYRLSGIEGRKSQARMVVYFSNLMVQKMQDAKFLGLDLYSHKYGVAEESLVKL